MINCLIVDDEPLALDILENYINKTPYLDLKARCNGVKEAMRHMDEEDIDLLFLDIQMPEVSGLEFSQTLGDRVKIIFTTAFEQYALDGFKVNALDYLLKPFNYQEFLTAANRAKDWFDLNDKAKKNLQQSINADDSLFVKSEYKIIKVKLDNLLFVQGLKDYVKFHLADNPKPILSLMSLKALDGSLPPNRFMRVHRSFIVNLDKIETIQRNMIIFDKEHIPVADKYKDQFQEFIKSKFLE